MESGQVAPGGLGQAGRPVAAHDQHVAHASVGQLGAHVCPEGGSFLGLDPDTQDVLDTVHVHPDRDVSRAGGDPVINADLDPNRVEVDHRVELLQRAALPLQDSLGYRVGDPRNGPHAELHAERGGQVVLDIPHRHSTGVQADDHRIQAVQAALTFAHQTRGEGPGPVPGHHRSQKDPPQSPPS